MSKLTTPYAVQMTRKGKDKVEVMVASTTLHKNNQNLEALVKEGFTVSETLARTKGGLTFGGNAQFYLYVIGTDAKAKALDGTAYGKLVESEQPAKKEVKEEPVVKAAVPEEKVVLQGAADSEVEASEKPAPAPKTTRRTKETTK